MAQDTKNLIKKRDKYYPKLIREAKTEQEVEYWTKELATVTEKIKTRQKNREKN